MPILIRLPILFNHHKSMSKLKTKNLTFLQRLFKIEQTREMPTTPTRDIKRPRADVARCSNRSLRPQNNNIGTGTVNNQKIRLRGLWWPYLSRIKPELSLKQQYIIRKKFCQGFLECGGNGNCTRKTMSDNSGFPLRYPHININYISHHHAK